jgi:hypothetical protein
MRSYQVSLPWQELVQVREEAFHPALLQRFFTPLACNVALTVVLLNPVPWQAEQLRLRCLECSPVAGGSPWQLPHLGAGAGVGAGVTFASASAIPWTWLELREERVPIPPALVSMPVWILEALAPALLEVASGA